MTSRSIRRLAAAAASTAVGVTAAVAVAAAAPTAHAAGGIIYHDPSPAQVMAYVHKQAQKPYMGWSSWSLQSTNYPGVNNQGDCSPAPNCSYSWLSGDRVIAQAEAMAKKLKSSGYTYINMDAGWWRKWDWTPEYDQYGRPAVDAARFPDGIKTVIDKIHSLGLKAGIYLPVGIEKGGVDNGPFPVYGAPGCTTADVIYPDKRPTNAWDSSYKMDFSNPCAQYYLDSIAKEFADWGVDFFKMDGMGPGSEKDSAGSNYDNTTDVRAWATALAGSGRDIHFELSWALNHDDIATWQRWSNGWRISIDVECYCDTIVQWAPNPTGNKNSIVQRFAEVAKWTGDAHPGGWNDLDGLDVGNAEMDGITADEAQTYATLWAIEAAPLFTGDDLTKLDAAGLKMLTNKELIAIDQAGVPARPWSTMTPQQVWSANMPDGSTVIALFNLGDNASTVSVNLADLGLSGKMRARNVWTHQGMAVAKGMISEDLPAHGSALFRVTMR